MQRYVSIRNAYLTFVCLGCIHYYPYFIYLNRLSFVTEQVAEHTNGTIGALLNATFGNAPELLIATAALRSGFYRVVQLAMLGSILTNLLFVFGMSCLIGGMRWQVQEIRVISGNVSVGMLYLSAAGSLLPAALFLSGQLPTKAFNDDVPSREELVFCRINAAVMVVLYLCYLLFQLGTHKEEFDDNEQSAAKDNHPAQRNLWCQRHVMRERVRTHHFHVDVPPPRRMEKAHRSSASFRGPDGESVSSRSTLSDTDFENEYGESSIGGRPGDTSSQQRRRRRQRKPKKSVGGGFDHNMSPLGSPTDVNGLNGPPQLRLNGQGSFHSDKGMLAPKLGMKCATGLISTGKTHLNSLSNATNTGNHQSSNRSYSHDEKQHTPLLSFRAGLLWLFIITLCISSMSDILVDTLEGFAQRSNMSQVFTSLVVVPYFSNIAEQASAILFAYRNEMDLCLGVTVGSAIQIGAFVMPGSVLIGYLMDRSMTLYFHGFETMCYLFSVVVVAAVVQGGSTNWLVGLTMIGIYIMMAAGFWVHETEDLSIDAETYIRNSTLVP